LEGKLDADEDALRTSPRLLPCYELARLGYVAIGRRYLKSIIDWCWLLLVVSVRSHQPFSNFQRYVFSITQELDGTNRAGKLLNVYSAQDPEIACIRYLELSLRPFR
jgi:hypothetical protein